MVQLVIQQKSKLIIKTLLHILLLNFLLLSSSCAVTAKQENIIPELSVGTGTDRRNEIQMIELTFDDSWRSAKGNISCCWGTEGGGQSHSNVIAPKNLKVSWFDYEPERIFRAEVTLSDKLYQYTQNLPSYYWLHQQEIESNIIPRIIVGLGSSGEVVVWVSNAATSRNKKGRVMHEVGRGQAVCMPSINEGIPDNCQGLSDEPKIERPF